MKFEKEKKPELYYTKELEELVNKVYDSCVNMECENCPRNGEIDGESCMSDIIMELWRRWHNSMNGYPCS